MKLGLISYVTCWDSEEKRRSVDGHMTSKLGTYKCGAGPAMGVGGQRASCASQPLRMQLPALSLFWLLTSGAPAAVAGGFGVSLG
jgi:hypothetical protein